MREIVHIQGGQCGNQVRNTKNLHFHTSQDHALTPPTPPHNTNSYLKCINVDWC